MKLKNYEIVDELTEIRNISAFIAEGLASALLLEIEEKGIITNSGINGACTMNLNITCRLGNLIENFNNE